MRAIIRTTLIFALLLSPAGPHAAPADDPIPARLPLDIAWTRPFPFGESFVLVPSASRLLVVLPERLDAYAWAATGDPLWTASVALTVPPVIDNSRIFLAGAEQIQAVSEVSGHVEWRLPTGRVSVQPTAQAGWLIVAGDDLRLRAVSASDGRVIWEERLTIALTAPMVIDGDLLVGAFQDGVIRAWNITDGASRWSTPVGTRPTQLLAAHGHVVFTGENGRLTSLQQRTGRQAWSYRLDIAAAGRITADAAHVYVTTIDNSVRAHDHRGHQVWRKVLPGRVIDGVLVDEGRVYVPQSNGEIRVFLAKDGAPGGRLPTPPQSIARGGLKSMGEADTLRLLLTQSEQSTRSITLYQRAEIPVTVATSAPGIAVPLAPPGSGGRP